MDISPAELEYYLMDVSQRVIHLSEHGCKEWFHNDEAIEILAQYAATNHLFQCGYNVPVPLAILFLMQEGPKNILRVLLRNGLNLNEKDREGHPCIFYLLKCPGLEEKYGDVFFHSWTPDLNQMDTKGRNCLTYFVEKSLDPLDILAQKSHMSSHPVMTIQKVEGVKNIDLNRRLVLELKWDDGTTFYGLPLSYDRSTVIVPIKQGSEQGLELIPKEQSTEGNSDNQINFDIGNLLTADLEYHEGNKVTMITSQGRHLQGVMQIADIEKTVLYTNVLNPLDRLFIPHTDQPNDQFKKCKITAGQHVGRIALMMSLTETEKRLLLLIEERDGRHIFNQTFVSLTQDQYEFIHLDGEPLCYTEYEDIMTRCYKSLCDLSRVTRLGI